MKKLFIIITFISLFLSINAYSSDTKIDIKKLDEIKLKSLKKGHLIKDAAGNNLYWLPYQKKYVDCYEFIETGNSIHPDLVKGLEGVKPVCEAWIFGDGKSELDSTEVIPITKKPKDIKGKKLWCAWRGDEDLGFGFEFNNNNKVKLKGIDDDNEKLFTIKGEYQALSNKIIIKYKNLDNYDEEITISRKTLKIIGSSTSCEPINKSNSIDNKLKRALDKLISEKSSENKF